MFFIAFSPTFLLWWHAPLLHSVLLLAYYFPLNILILFDAVALYNYCFLFAEIKNSHKFAKTILLITMDYLNSKRRVSTVDCFLAIIFVLIIILVFVQVFCRYVFNAAPSWTEEIAKYLFVWMTFVGAAAAFRDNIHIGVDFFVSLLPASAGKFMGIVDKVLVVSVSAVLTVIGVFWTVDVWGMLSPAVGLPIALVLYAALPVGSALIVYYGIMNKKEQ